MSIFSQVQITDSIEMIKIRDTYFDDTFKNKINLEQPMFTNERGDVWRMPMVHLAEKVITFDDILNKACLPVLGLESFRDAATKLLLGNESLALLEGRAFSAQVLSGTNGLRVAAEFLHKHLNYKTVYISSPSWRNYDYVFRSAKFENILYYSYWNISTRSLNIEAMLRDLRNARTPAVVVLQVCAHSPSSYDPTKAQWMEIANVVKEKNLFPVLFSPFQGIASGDVDEDAWVVRYFVSNGFEFFCSQALGKNFAFCNERIGNLVCVTKNSDVITNLKSQLALIITGLYSRPALHVASVVTYILNDPQLYDEWKENIKAMYLKCEKVRINLRQALEKLGTPGRWAHITQQRGMFANIGLTKEQIVYLMNTHHVYIRICGRINLSAVNANNLDLLAKAICDTIKSVPANAPQCC